ncbi:MAG TPA: ATP-binding cassette domain-containing protein [Eubacteriaceae bacterium]|nr:ATP-binding cassette domain-containing protein [Eubacteriaceae bacterium]
MDIFIENLTKEYENKRVLDIDTLNINQGRIIGIVGSNGAGKSTLIKILGGLEQPDSGSISYNGEKDFDKIYRDITIVFQQPYLLVSNVYNNIAYPLKVRKYKNSDIKNRVNTIMKDMGIDYLAKQKARTLSGGERQKVALARAIIFNPSLLLLDEPTANIDPDSMNTMEDTIKKFNKTNGSTIIIVTHNPEQAKRLCDEIIVMDKGKIKRKITNADFNQYNFRESI